MTMSSKSKQSIQDELKQWALDHFDDHLDLLKELVKIPSVSFEGYDPAHVLKSAQLVKNMMEDIGLNNTQLIQIDDAHPYVYGDKIKDPKLPTILLYAHHDVQPPMRENLWDSPPFEPTIRDGRIFGRGTADDKAGIVIHLASIHAYLDLYQELPINVKVIIEGEEEIGSEHLPKFLNQYAQLLSADAMVLADLANYDTGIPSITTSLRGVLVCEVELRSMKHALHSGLWSGPLPDPAMGLCKLLSSITDETGALAIDEMNKMVIPPSPSEKLSYTQLKMTEEVLRHQTQLVKGANIDPEGEVILEKLWRQPSVVVNSIEVAQKKTAGNVIMDVAWARVGIRLAPGMNAKKCQSIFEDHLNAHTPWGLELKIKSEPPVNPWYCSPEDPIFDAAANAMKLGYEQETVFIGCGASIPFVEPMSEALGNIPAILIGVEDPYCRAHGENESLNLDDFRKAILSQIYFFNELS